MGKYVKIDFYVNRVLLTKVVKCASWCVISEWLISSDCIASSLQYIA